MGLVRCGRERAQPHSRLIRIGGRASQGSSSLATLGFVAESLRDSCDSSAKLWVMISPRREGEATADRLDFHRLWRRSPVCGSRSCSNCSDKNEDENEEEEEENENEDENEDEDEDEDENENEDED